LFLALAVKASLNPDLKGPSPVNLSEGKAPCPENFLRKKELPVFDSSGYQLIDIHSPPLLL
jgi:hypothetical protein